MDFPTSPSILSRVIKGFPTTLSLVASITAGQVMAQNQEAPTLGFEIQSKVLHSDATDCDNHDFAFNRVRTAETQIPILTQRNTTLAEEKETLDVNIVSLNDQLTAEQQTLTSRQETLALAKERLVVAENTTDQARADYRKCRETGSRSECQKEYDLYIESRNQERAIKAEISGLESEILDTEYNIQQYTRDLNRANTDLSSVEQKIESNTLAINNYQVVFPQYIQALKESGEVTEINLYGDITPLFEGKNFFDINAFYSANERNKTSVGPGFGVLEHHDSSDIFSGISLPGTPFVWPATDMLVSDMKEGQFQQAFAQDLGLYVRTDIESSCVLRDESPTNTVQPSVNLILDEAETLSFENTYSLDLDLSLISDQVLSSANDYGYLSSDQLGQLIENINGISLTQTDGNNDTELSTLSTALKQDLLYRFVSTIGVPVISLEDATCLSNPWCDVISGWWLSTPDSQILPSDIIAQTVTDFVPSTTILQNSVYIANSTRVPVVLNAPKPPVCEEGQELVEGVCQEIPPECEPGYELVEGVCQEIPPECEPGYELVEGVCQEIPPECEPGYELVEGVCQEIPPECEPGYELVEGVCQEIPPECAPGEELVEGVCQQIPPECGPGEELVEGVCQQIPPECGPGQELVEGVCQDIPPVCEPWQELVEGVCQDIPPVCEPWQELVGGVCQDIPPVCEPGQELVEGVCQEAPPECEAGQILIDGICQDNPCNEDEVFIFDMCIPKSLLGL